MKYRVESFVSWHGDRRWQVLDHQLALAAGPYRSHDLAFRVACYLANQEQA